MQSAYQTGSVNDSKDFHCVAIVKKRIALSDRPLIRPRWYEPSDGILPGV